MRSLDYALLKSKLRDTKSYTVLEPNVNIWKDVRPITPTCSLRDLPEKIQIIVNNEFIQVKKSIEKLYNAHYILNKWQFSAKIPKFIDISGPKLKYENFLVADAEFKLQCEMRLKNYKSELYDLLKIQKYHEVEFYSIIANFDYFKDQCLGKIELVSGSIPDFEFDIPSILAAVDYYRDAISLFEKNLYGNKSEQQKNLYEDRNHLYLAKIAAQKGFIETVRKCYDNTKTKDIKKQISLLL